MAVAVAGFYIPLRASRAMHAGGETPRGQAAHASAVEQGGKRASE